MSERVQIPMKPVATAARPLKPAPSATLLRRCACGGSGDAGGAGGAAGQDGVPGRSEKV